MIFAGSTVVTAQYGRGRVNNDPYRYCMNLPDITDKQKSDIIAMSEKHRAEMDALRNDMWGSTDIEKRNELRLKMATLRNSHFNDIQSLLTDNQKEAFNSVCPAYRGRAGKGMDFYNGRGGRGSGRGFRR